MQDSWVWNYLGINDWHDIFIVNKDVSKSWLHSFKCCLIAGCRDPIVDVVCYLTVSIGEELHSLFSLVKIKLWRTCLIKHLCHHLLSHFSLINLRWKFRLRSSLLKCIWRVCDLRSGCSCDEVYSVRIKKLMTFESSMNISRMISCWFLSSNESEKVSQNCHHFWHVKFTLS